MPQNALDNPLVLPMLGLLVESPRHQYALLRELRTRYAFLPVKTATVYTLVQTLARQGLVAVAEEDERPEVSLTEAGFADFRERVERQLSESDPNVGARFVIALAYVGVLPRERAVRLLRDRADALRADRRALAETIGKAGLAELQMVEAHFLESRLRHDAGWLTRLATRLEAGELD
ncbi:PadR family transcriptional regulator [Amycolatopsis jiangsuensis]|uniref:DNA-binding PadR family transcriptional regulator n=1 Tax=Amycolatopsis jiangsuensis TaxID=1181879 RepID=A0A840IVZ2_9PSEU|nr:helix-turn-helix transcriptional regulator [Amycolatopsis jiangsuensis]MBB4685689.1 DNA-binding PadR family transcriptional regulator [Amycolatopsis jiangsuensis]